jgi:DNA modification methylase
VITLLRGDCRELLSGIAERSVQCCVCSPPYWKLRKYTNDPREIGQEAAADCLAWARNAPPCDGCYVCAMRDVFGRVWRVLRDDGVLWVNLGDSLKDKDLMMLPARVALALQADGYYLRNDIIWSKANAMPSSVTDRCTISHEYIFLFAKRPRYFYDQAAIAEALKGDGRTRGGIGGKQAGRNGNNTYSGRVWQDSETSGTRNARTVWNIPTRPLADEHYAAYPEELARRCVLAGSSPQACEVCGAPWVRVMEKGEPVQQHWAPGTQEKIDTAQGRHGATSVMNTGYVTPKLTTGWLPTCACPDATGSGRCVILDPFAGSGTTLRVAESLQRDSIGIDLGYQELQEKRTNGVQIEMVGM